MPLSRSATIKIGVQRDQRLLAEAAVRLSQIVRRVDAARQTDQVRDERGVAHGKDRRDLQDYEDAGRMRIRGTPRAPTLPSSRAAAR